MMASVLYTLLTVFLWDKGEHSYFLMFHYIGQSLLLSVGKNFGRIIPCLAQKTVAIIVPADDTLLNFFFLCYVMWHTIPLTVAWTRVQNARPRSRTP
jgi:hypothetical protein